MPGLFEKETLLETIASEMQGTGYVPSTRRGPDVPAGTIISREITGPAPPPGGILLKSPIPIWGFHPTLRIGGKGGFQPGYESVTEFVFAEPEPTEITQVVSPFIPVEPKIGKDVPIETVEKYKEVRKIVNIGNIFLTRYEKARIVGARALQISFGAPILVEKPINIIDPIKIAQLELKSKILPLTIRRELPDGEFQDIPINKLILKKD